MSDLVHSYCMEFFFQFFLCSFSTCGCHYMLFNLVGESYWRESWLQFGYGVVVVQLYRVSVYWTYSKMKQFRVSEITRQVPGRFYGINDHRDGQEQVIERLFFVRVRGVENISFVDRSRSLTALSRSQFHKSIFILLRRQNVFKAPCKAMMKGNKRKITSHCPQASVNIPKTPGDSSRKT